MSDRVDCQHLRVLISGGTCVVLLTSSSQRRVSLSFDWFRCIWWQNKCWCQLSFVIFARLSYCCCSPAAARWWGLLWPPPTRCTTWATSPTLTTASSPRCSKPCQSTEGRGGTRARRERLSPSTGTWNIWRRFTRSPPECRGAWTGVKSATQSDWSSLKMNVLHKVIKVSKWSSPADCTVHTM